MQVTGNKSLNAFRLSIRVFTDGFSLLTYDATQSGPLSEEFFPVEMKGQLLAQQLETALTRPRITDCKYDKVEVLACTPTTHIPLDEFRRDEMVPLYRLTFSCIDCAAEEVQYEILKSLEVVELFYLPPEVRETVVRTYPDAEIHAMHGRIMEGLVKRSPDTVQVDYVCHVQAVREHLYVSAFDSKGLAFACEYKASTDNNRFYYILCALKTLSLDLSRTQCLLCGISDTLKKNLQKYILFVESCE